MGISALLPPWLTGQLSPKATAMIEMSDGVDGQGGVMSHLQKASDETTKSGGCIAAPAPATESGDQTTAAPDEKPHLHQHASAALLLDLAASAKSAAAGNQENNSDEPPAATETKPAALHVIHRQMSGPTGGGHAGYHWMAETSAQSHSHWTLPAVQATPPQQREESSSILFPPRFDEIGSPFIHVADYAAGMAIRNNVLGSVMSELSFKEKNEEGALVNLVDEFIRGKVVLLERTSSPADESRNTKATPPAQILPVLAKDAPTIASWYNSSGDKALSYTSKAWSDWWVQRCGHPDVGCEMIKMVVYEGNNDHQQEVILALAYVERSVVDRYPIEVEDSPQSGEFCGDNEGSIMAPGQKRKKHEGENTVNSRLIRTTLLRGLRINPKYNPEVTRRLSGLSNRDSAISICGIPASLVVHVLAQSLRFGTEAVGVHCPKIDTAETFFQGLFQGDTRRWNITSNVTIPEDEDGRKYFRLFGERRWEVLRAAIVQQVRLSEHN